MPRHAQTATVQASPATVFAILDDVSRAPEWLARCTRLDNLSGGPTAVGSRLKYFYKEGGRTGEMDGEVVARQQDRKLTNRFTDKIMDVTVDFDVVPGVSPDQTTLTHTITITPRGLGRIFSPLIGRQLPGQTRGAITALKALAEAGR